MLGEIFAEIGAELGRLGTLGRAEAANALFTGEAYTSYGEGQQSVAPEEPQQEQPVDLNEIEHDYEM